MNYTRGNTLTYPGTHTSLRRLNDPPPALSLVEGGGFEPPKLARQIYSLIPLATREPLRKGAHSLDLGPLCQQGRRGNSALMAPLPNRGHVYPCATWQVAFSEGKKWSWREESNPRPADYKSAALPTELRQQRVGHGAETCPMPMGCASSPQGDLSSSVWDNHSLRPSMTRSGLCVAAKPKSCSVVAAPPVSNARCSG